MILLDMACSNLKINAEILLFDRVHSYVAASCKYLTTVFGNFWLSQSKFKA